MPQVAETTMQIGETMVIWTISWMIKLIIHSFNLEEKLENLCHDVYRTTITKTLTLYTKAVYYSSSELQINPNPNQFHKFV
jgi:hypothetical protein